VSSLDTPDIYYKKHKFDQVVFENGKALLADEDRQQRKYYFGPFTLGDEQFFMMGDNRDNSADSRYWGPVNYSNVIGRPLFIFWSIDDNFSLRFDRFLKTTSRL
jgi:signal peptidase I